MVVALERHILSLIVTIVLINAGRATDLPAADPVEYVRVCDAFGAGYSYIPGTDTCLKIDGYARSEAHWVDGNGSAKKDRKFNNFTTRARGQVNFDAQTLTDFGLLRSHIELRGTVGPTDTGGYSDRFNINMAYLTLTNDFGTLTGGHVGSFYDFWGGYAIDTRVGLDDPTDETNLLGFEIALGGELAASVAMEDKWARRYGVASAKIATSIVTDTDALATKSEGQEVPDLVGRLRVEQGWGEAQVMGVTGRVGTAGAANFGNDEKFGYAVGGGFRLKSIGPAEFVIEGDYTEGLVKYLTTGNGAIIYDAAENASNTGIDLTKAWAFRTGLEISLSSNVALAGDIGYASIDHQGVLRLEDYDTWAVAGTIQWEPISGLRFRTTAAFEEIDADSGASIVGDEESWGIEGRIQRSF